MKTLVLYHDNCPDGMTAAWVLWKAIGNVSDFRAVNYGQPAPDISGYERVIVADFSYPRDVMIDWAAKVNLVVLDHHKTAEENLRGLPFATFDMNKSGGHLAWDWVSMCDNNPMPRIVQFTEDRDLWRWALPGSREVSQWLRMIPMNLDEWDMAADELQDDGCFERAVEVGKSLLNFQNQQVDIMAKRAEIHEVCGYKIPVTNATCFFSEVGERMCELFPDAPCALYYFDRTAKIRQWGLRSRGGFDCTIIAKQFGGGGHPGAAGFTTPITSILPLETQ